MKKMIVMFMVIIFFANFSLYACKRFSIWSNVFKNYGVIPTRYTCDGEDISPPIRWAKLPKGTKSLAIIVDDPDAPSKIWVHWVVYNIPPNLKGLKEGASGSYIKKIGAVEGYNDFGKIGYGGPCPPKGDGYHRYFFKIYALKSKLLISYPITKKKLLELIKGIVIKKAQYIGKYRR